MQTSAGELALQHHGFSRYLRTQMLDVQSSRTFTIGQDVRRYRPMAAATRNRAELVGANIAARRRECGLTQQNLADRLGKPRHHVSAWETGVHEPRPARLEQIAAILGCRWTDFYDPPTAT